LPRGGFDSARSDPRHAAVIRGAPSQKTWAAVWFVLNDAASGRYRSGAKGIGWPENGHNGKTHGGGDVHRAGVVPNKQMALRKK
jgi:hypothetical protein